MKTAFLSLAFVVTVTACATNPATGKRQFSLMSEEQEIAAGQQNDVEVRREMGVYDDRALEEYITTTGMRLAQMSERPNLPWHFTVVDVPAINAFALPGGYIYITRGIPCVSRRRVAARRRARARDRSRHRAPCRAAVLE